MNDDRLKCEGCGKYYYPKGAWQHEDCMASKPKVVRAGPDKREDSSVDNEHESVTPRLPESPERELLATPKQRWDREKYNAYMRTNRHKWKKAKVE